MTNLNIHNRAFETDTSVALLIAEAISDNPFLDENVNQTYTNYFEFSDEIETEIKHQLEAWGVDLNDLEFMDVEEAYSEVPS